MILVSHPMGNANVRQAALGLAEGGLLSEYWTCVGWNPSSPFARVLPASVRAQLARRQLPELVRARTHFHPWREIGRLAASRLGWQKLTEPERGVCSVDAVLHSLDRRVARRLPEVEILQAVFAPEDGAAATFEAAKRLGLGRIYDLPIGYWRAAHRIYEEEAERKPEWASTLSGLLDSAAKLERKERELEAADVVVVASSFTRRTLLLAPRTPGAIHIVSYGAPPSSAPPNRAGPGPLKVMFAGSLSQRKGLAYLLEAVDSMAGAVELTLLGRKPTADCRPLNEATARHRWIASLPHFEVLAEMRRQDVLVFPSLFEGFGLVILEAMACGIPVIATDHTAGPDLITHGTDGFIIPIRSATAISEKLDLLARDKELLSAMKSAAQATAAHHTWENYGSTLCDRLRENLTFPCPPQPIRR